MHACRQAASQAGGLVAIVANPVEHAILSVPTTELINYGVLTAAAQRVGMRVHTCTACGRLAGAQRLCVAQCDVATASATCSTSDAAVLGVDGCAAVLDGTETGSSPGVVITAAVGGFALRRTFQVWRPAVPLTLSVGRVTLHKIRGYFNASDCDQPLYQSTELRINASFHAGAGRQVPDVDVSHLLRDQIVVVSEFARGTVSTAVLSDVGCFLPRITGAAAGQGRIFVRKGTVDLGTLSSTLTISDTPVDITDLEVYPASRLEMATVPDANATRAHAERYPVSAVPTLSLFIEGHVAHASASIIMRDNHVEQIAPGLLRLVARSSGGPLTVASNNVTLVASGSSGSAVIDASVVSCGSAALAATVVRIDVAIQDPVGVRITRSQPKIVHADAPALRLLPAEHSVVRVFLIYESGEEREMTHDSRIGFVYGNAALFFLQSVGGELRAIARPDVDGAGTFGVRFDHVDDALMDGLDGNSATVTVVRLRALDLLSYPFPAYPNSEAATVSTISRFNGLELFQRLTVRLVATRSDGVAHVVTTDTAAAITVGGAEATVSPATGTVILAPDAAGQLRLEARYGTSAIVAVLVITVSADPVTVQSLAMSIPSTLRAVAGAVAAQTAVAAVFSDGTRYLALLSPTGAPALPGLLTFASNDDAAQILETSGTVSVHGNSLGQITLATAVVGSSVAATALAHVNLDPAVSDVDLGARDGAPLGVIAAGNVLSVPVRVNTGSGSIGSFDLLVAYNAAHLTPVEAGSSVRVIPGADLQAGGYGNLFAVVVSHAHPGGQHAVQIVGYPRGGNQRGSAYHVCTLQFRVGDGVTAGEVAALGGEVRLFTTFEDASVALIDPEHVFVAGAVRGTVVEGRRRRRALTDGLEAAVGFDTRFASAHFSANFSGATVGLSGDAAQASMYDASAGSCPAACTRGDCSTSVADDPCFFYCCEDGQILGCLPQPGDCQGTPTDCTGCPTAGSNAVAMATGHRRGSTKHVWRSTKHVLGSTPPAAAAAAVMPGSPGKSRWRSQTQAPLLSAARSYVPSELHPAHGRARRQEDCGIPGDASCNGVFDIRDASFTSRFIVERLIGFTGTFRALFTGDNEPTEGQLREMDADLNGEIDGLDALYLAKGAVQMTRFVRSAAFATIPVNASDTGCVLRIQTQVLLGGGGADPSAFDAHRTAVYVLSPLLPFSSLRVFFSSLGRLHQSRFATVPCRMAHAPRRLVHVRLRQHLVLMLGTPPCMFLFSLLGTPSCSKKIKRPGTSTWRRTTASCWRCSPGPSTTASSARAPFGTSRATRGPTPRSSAGWSKRSR